MFNLEEYLKSPIIESYCLGVASKEEIQDLEYLSANHPEVRMALENAQLHLEKLVGKFKKQPSPNFLNKILNQLPEEETAFENIQLSHDQHKLQQFVPISKHSNYLDWNKLINGIQPPAKFDLHLHELYRDSRKSLFVLWIKDSIPEEVHKDTYESVLLLNGNCQGKLNDQIVDLKAGDFWKIPRFAKHSLINTSKEPVKLILMRRLAVAA